VALYEYGCPSCKTVFEKRMPMSDVVQFLKCPKCGKRAKKTMGNFAVVGRSDAGFGDSPAPWDSDGGDDDFGGGDDDFGGHGHSHGPGGHTH